jgi:hypothetical protein
MAGSQNPEIAIDAIITILTADTPALFDAIDVEQDDGITLRDVVKWYRAPLQAYDEYPASVVMASQTQYPDIYRSDNIRWHDLQIQLYEQSIEDINSLLPQEVCTVRLERMMQGFHEALVAKEDLVVSGTPQTDHILIGGVQYSDFVPLEGRGYLRGAKMDLQALFSL